MDTRIPTITSAGFQFVLHTPNDQLWDLLLQYFHLAEVFYTSAILFCKSTDCVVSGAANGFGRSFGVHIHALDHGTWKSDYLQHFFNERQFDGNSIGILY
jgi:hypothetical protein